MTSGTRWFGAQYPVITYGGAGYVKLGYGSKTWSGTDWPKTKLTKAARAGRRKQILKAFSPDGYLTEEWYQTLSIPKEPPQRSRNEEHPYTMSLDTSTDVVFNYSAPFGALPYRDGLGQQGWGLLKDVNYGWTSNDDIALMGKLREMIAGSEFNAGVALAESKMALGMIANAATRIYAAWHHGKRGNWEAARQYLVNGTPYQKIRPKSAANNWLELQYGWLPLLKDVENGAQFLAHHYSVPPQMVVRVSRKARGTAGNTGMPYNSNGWGTSNIYTRKTIKAIIKEKNVVALAGLTDPLSVAWELLPYSFVLDWFIPVGDFLSARSLSQAVSGTFVVSEKQFLEVETLLGGGSNQRVFTGTSQIGWKRVNVTRTVTTSLAVPLPSLKPLKKALSWRHTLNAVALVTQKVK